jgi:hypothetical protein
MMSRTNSWQVAAALRSAGIEQLVYRFAKGDRHARRDLLTLAERLGVDLVAGQGEALEQSVAAALSANDEALLPDYVRRHAGQADRAGEIDAPSRARSNRLRNHSRSARNPNRRNDR